MLDVVWRRFVTSKAGAGWMLGIERSWGGFGCGGQAVGWLVGGVQCRQGGAVGWVGP